MTDLPLIFANNLRGKRVAPMRAGINAIHFIEVQK
jgi:hypothetical protein